MAQLVLIYVISYLRIVSVSQNSLKNAQYIATKCHKSGSTD